MVSATKDPAKVRAGQAGMRKRWGPPRILRLDALTAPQRRVILGIIDVFAHEKAAPDVETGAARSEVRVASAEPTA
jgi:hypothetical protein